MHNFNPSYIGPRDDILKLIPIQSRKVLDVGCSVGTLGQQLKQRQNMEVVGIELNREMAKIARTNLDKIITADVEKIDLKDHFFLEYFDCIILADILEHLKDPWRVIKNLTTILSNDGTVIACLPNVRHYTTIINLVLKGHWPYRERGIHDRTHLRFFALQNIKELFQSSGMNITRIERKYRLFERPHYYNKYSRFLAFPVIREFLTFQYVIVAQKGTSS